MKYITPTLETERLVLKKGTFEDFKQVYEYDFTRLRNIAGEFEFIKYDSDKLKGFVTYADEEENVLDFIVFLKDNKKPIGNITFDRYDENNKSLEIAVNLHPSYWRRGYMTEALLCSMEYIFDNLDIENIIYSYDKDNFRSKGLSDKIGFEFCHEYVEHYTRIDKDVESVKNIMSKDNFYNLYKNNKKVR